MLHDCIWNKPYNIQSICINVCEDGFVEFTFVYHCLSKFKAGDGDLELYCTEADKLHNELLSCPRPLPRIATTPLPPTPRDCGQTRYDHWSTSDSPSTTPPRRLLESRRMSRSEGDLKKFVMQQSAPTLRSAGSQQHLVFMPRSNGLAQKVGVTDAIVFCKAGN